VHLFALMAVSFMVSRTAVHSHLRINVALFQCCCSSLSKAFCPSFVRDWIRLKIRDKLHGFLNDSCLLWHNIVKFMVRFILSLLLSTTYYVHTHSRSDVWDDDKKVNVGDAESLNQSSGRKKHTAQLQISSERARVGINSTLAKAIKI